MCGPGKRLTASIRHKNRARGGPRLPAGPTIRVTGRRLESTAVTTPCHVTAAVPWCLVGSDGHGAARVEDKEAVLEKIRATGLTEHCASTRERTLDARATAHATEDGASNQSGRAHAS
jgi:hypothetical protein